jgi:hypothetical protein
MSTDKSFGIDQQRRSGNTSSYTSSPTWVKSLIGLILMLLILQPLLSMLFQPASPSAATAPAIMARQLTSRAAAEKATFQINRNAALYRRATELGWGEPLTDEISFTVAGTTYVAQGYKNGILFTAVGHWGRADIQGLAW